MTMLKEAIQGFTISPQQRDLWLLRPGAGGSPYCVQGAVLIAGEVSPVALRGALADLVERHEILRTSFPCLSGMSLPVQAVGEPFAPEIREPAAPGEGSREARIEGWMREARARRREPGTETPLDVVLAALAPGERVLVITLPALCADAPSLEILARDLQRLCAARTGGGRELPEAFQYADVAEWQNQLLEDEKAALGREHWEGRGGQASRDSGLPFQLRVPGPEMEPGTVVRDPGPGWAERVEAAAVSLGVPAATLLQACWLTLLRRLTGRTDLLVAAAFDGRRYEDLAGAVGPLTRYLPVRCRAGEAARLPELLAALEEDLAACRQWQEYFSWETPEEGRRFPAFGFDFESGSPAGGTPFALVARYSCTERFQLRLSAALRREGLELRFHYDAGCLDRGDVESLSGQYVALLAGLLAAPERPVGTVGFLAAGERRELVEAFNRTARDYPRELCVHELFEQQARRSPGAVAVVWGGRRMSFGELDREAGRLARRLRGLGVGPETRVGLLLERSPAQVVALLAVLKAGGAYVPLDPSNPRERLAWLVSDSGLGLVLTQESLADRLPEGVRRLLVAEETAEAGPESALEPLAGPENLAYVLYTSGSTGRPKGVMVPHRALVNYVSWALEAYRAAEGSGAPVHSPLAFDLTVTSLLVPLLAGNRVLLLNEAEGVEALGLALRREGDFSLVKLTPAHLRILAQELTGPALAGRTRALVVGGEALTWESLEPWRAHAPQTRVVNEYGPTEAAVGCCVYEVEGEGRGPVPIGRPIANARIYVLDRELRPVPRWVAGEIHVGGDGLARGYLGRGDLTAASFVPDPFGAPGDRLYRTGDLARFGSDGALEFLGREDHQVKVRGFRIEPGEVEQALLGHPGVSEAVVGTHEDASGDRRLVAWVVGKGGAKPGLEELRRHLSERLPEPMIPSSWVELAALPLTANGKVDRRALPAPGEPEPGQTHVSPRTPVEEILAALWSEVLGVERIGTQDDFLRLGGHSLTVARLVSRVRQTLNVELPMRSVFETPVLADLARRIAAARRGEAGADAERPPLVPVSREGELPLSFAQQRLWFVDQLEGGSAAFNIPLALRLLGKLDVAALERTLDRLVERHETLRTTFPAVAGRPAQTIAAPRPHLLPRVDLSDLSPDRREAEQSRLALEEAGRAFDLARGPLFRVALLIGGREEHVLLVDMHHIISDAWSLGVLVDEVAALYRRYSLGEDVPLPALPVQYADYARWQQDWLRGEVLESQLAYWRRQLAGAPALCELPGDHPRPAGMTYRGAVHRVELPAGLSEALAELSRREGATLFMTLLAAFYVLLHRYTGQDDLVVGTDSANRTQGETEGLIGFFINQLVLRASVASGMTFRDLLAQVRDVAIAAYTHQEVPFEKLVDALQAERDLRVSPLFQVKFFLQNAASPELELPGLRLQGIAIDNHTAKLDFTLALSETPQGLRGWINYSTDLFEEPTIAKFVAAYEAVLARLVQGTEVGLHELEREINRVEKEYRTMQNKTAGISFQQFRKAKPQVVTLPQQGLVERDLLSPGQPMPLVLRPAVQDLDAADWAAGQRESLDQDLLRHGAILLRGFGAADSTEAFERFSKAVCRELFSDNGEHPRETVSGKVYTPVFFPPDQKLLWHNENSFNARWPLKILFGCQSPAERGGETPVVDSRRVHDRLDPALRERFAKGVMYVRNFNGQIGLDWQTVFRTDDREEVERRCRAEGIELEWRSGDRLQTRAVRPAAIRHPQTGEMSWFNQAQHWHLSCLDPATRQSLEALFSEDDLPRSCRFGDGSPIPDEDMRQILDVYRELEVCFPWQQGDVLLLDNVLVAHARNPFAGPRKLLVALGEMTSYGDLVS